MKTFLMVFTAISVFGGISMVISFWGSETPMEPNLRHCYVDSSGNIRIRLSQVNRAEAFSDGLALVENKDYLSGYIDRTGTFKINPQFPEARRFSEGLAAVIMEAASIVAGKQLWGYIDQNGNIVVEPAFDSAFSFSEGVAVASISDMVVTISKEEKVLPLFKQNHLVLGQTDGEPKFVNGLLLVMDTATSRFGFVNKSGEIVIPAQFNSAFHFSEGLARVSVIENKRELVGFIDATGAFIIPPTLDVDFDPLRNSSDFSEGLAGIVFPSETVLGLPGWYFIDATGKVVLRTKYSYGWNFNEGLAAVFDPKRGAYGYVDANGHEILAPLYESAGDFSEGLAPVSLPAATIPEGQ